MACGSRIAMMLAAGVLATGTMAWAQDTPTSKPAASPDKKPAVAAPTAPEAPEVRPPAPEGMRYWMLRGGGEVVGREMKRTPSEVFIDIGPRIIGVPADSIIEDASLEKAPELSAAPQLGRARGVYDPETGSLVFTGGAKSGTEMLSQQEMVDQAKKSVVLITNPRGAGSGFVLDTQGHIVTNHHVVRNEKYQTVNIFKKTGDKWERLKLDNVPVEAYSDLYDIALLKLDLKDVEAKGVELVPLPIAAPGTLQVGDDVFAIGNPGGIGQLLEHSVTEGIASSLARNVGDVLYIQTTAAVNPGNSGGPLINARGEVVGLITLKAFMQEGIGFALPVELINVFLSHPESYAYSEKAENKGVRYLPPE
ncbi:MAG: serine protease Do [Candidatus Sumerlaeota bacterium]|nr:serine protease Do [Candidatus Sumerlaeota bacterium]